jgi:hypothetical protein
MTCYCISCGVEIPDNAEFCHVCGAKQSSKQFSCNRINPGIKTQSQAALKKTPKWVWVILFIIAFGIIGNIRTEDKSSSSSSQSGSTITPTYRWVTLQTIHFNTNEEYFNWILEKDYPIFTVPYNAIEWRADITWIGGDKDSYIKLTLWRWGEDDDVNIGTFYKNSKQGTDTWSYTNISKGNKYYVEASSIFHLEGTIVIYVKVPS